MKIDRPFVALDLETTGTWIEKDRIIEIGMIRCSPDGSRESYVKRVNPGMPVPASVTRLTGIADGDLEGAPSFKDIAEEVLAFIGDADLGGFNVHRFDLPILEREFFTVGIKFEWRTRTVYDAQRIYHLHEKRDLKAAYKFYCDKDLVNAHSALGDTEATLEILVSQVGRYGTAGDGLASLKNYAYEPGDFFGREKKFRWWNGKLFPVFGKYARKWDLKEIAEKDPEYLQWLLTTDFEEEVKELIRAHLSPV
ncbi:MAG: hypothetical protein A3D28_01765 [Omnitrophica bacterium RIFCSPHIGHO2_02_FULL_63_14]|nr:MAG: hypothetical protein A3D28_01765 [Omnitrophica bacterium RIFCSPHIGHO2_02_FULL_63_14]